MVIHKERFGNALAFVIAAADANRVHVSPIIFCLRVYRRIAVDFTRRSLQNPGLHTFRHAEHVDRAHHARLDRLYRIELVMDRACGACQVKDAVHFQQNRFRHVVADKLEATVVTQVRDIRHAARKVVVKANHLVTVVQQTLAQVTPQEPRTTSN